MTLLSPHPQRIGGAACLGHGGAADIPARDARRHTLFRSIPSAAAWIMTGKVTPQPLAPSVRHQVSHLCHTLLAVARLTPSMALNMLMSAMACANLYPAARAERLHNPTAPTTTYWVKVLKRLTTSFLLRLTCSRPSCVSANSTRIAVAKPCTLSLPQSRHVEHSTQSIISEMLRNLLRKSP